ncbi:hypothetical protein BKA62DRAFT_700136 [Auriculariales sp. MPI-PUGE-AT-0066]|nr:hypothetical protein BKA62DRAFT_700136 [Auriculariales sp. MPI-PUGE-AT-0066]
MADLSAEGHVSHEERVILQIQQDNGVDKMSLHKAQKDPELKTAITNLQHVVTVAAELLSNDRYTKPAHCCLELLKNADNNIYPTDVAPELRITLRQGYMEIKCNEIGFSDENVRAFCGIRKSTKKNQAGIVVAKSVFKVAKRITIQSKGYSFELDRDRLLGTITPVWCADLRGDPGWTTMRLELVDNHQFAILKAQLVKIRQTALLFSRKLARLTIDDGAIFLASKTVDGSLVQLETTIPSAGRRAATTPTFHRYLRVAHYSSLPLGSTGEPLSEPNRMVHAFFPLRSVGFRFLIQADFLTAAGHEDVLIDRTWNIAIRDALADVFVAAVAEFMAHAALKLTWLLFLPRTDEVVHPFFAPIVTSIISKLKLLPVVITSDNSHALAAACKRPGSYISSDDRRPLVPPKHAPFKYVSDLYPSKVAPIFVTLGIVEMQYDDFINGLEAVHAALAFASQRPGWLEDVSDKILLHGVQSNKISSHGVQSKNIPLHGVQRNKNVLPGAQGKRQRGSWLREDMRVRQLPFARRQDGVWCTCEKSRISSIFFGVAGFTFPTGLDIEMLDLTSHGSRHQELLRYLGVRDVDVSIVVDRILDLHLSSRGLREADILTHLQFLFQHRKSHCRSDLPAIFWLLDVTGAAAHGNQLYLEPSPAYDSYNDLQSLLPLGRFVLPDLLGGQLSTFHGQEWFHTALGVATSPRLTSSGQPSAEFLRLINSVHIALPGYLLQLLREFWPELMNQLDSFDDSTSARRQFFDYMRRLEFRCINGVVASLAFTFILEPSLNPFVTSDMLLLPVADTNLDWSFLLECGVTICGVTMDVNAAFFLKRLRSLALFNNIGVEFELVEEIYKQLESRFHDCPDEIRAAFSRENLIFADGVWCPLSYFVWDGPPILTIKRKLRISYPHLKALFQKYLNVKDATDDIVGDELQRFAAEHVDVALSQLAVERLQRLLAFGSSTIRRVESGELPDWPSSLLKSAVLPIRMPETKQIRLASADSTAFYVSDPTGALAEIFATTAQFLSLDPGTVVQMQPLLARFEIDNRRIDKFVQQSVAVDYRQVADSSRYNTLETAFYFKRLPLLERIYYYKMKKPLPIRRAKVIGAHAISVRYELFGQPSATTSLNTDCHAIVHNELLVVLLSHYMGVHNRRNYSVASAITEALGMHHDDISIVRSILHDSESDVEHLLNLSGVHQVPVHLRQTFDSAPVEESDDNMETGYASRFPSPVDPSERTQSREG